MALTKEEFEVFKTHQYCDNPSCGFHGQVGQENIKTHSVGIRTGSAIELSTEVRGGKTASTERWPFLNLEELKNFAKGLRQDYEAVKLAFMLTWNNG